MRFDMPTPIDDFPVLLIATNVEKDPYPVYPIGAAIIASVLEGLSIPVEAIDFAFLDDPAAAVVAAIRATPPRLIGISVRAVDNTCLIDQRTYLPKVKNLISVIRSTTTAPIVIGGSGYSLFPELMLDFLGADFGVVGEGEATIIDLVDRVRTGQDPTGIPGLVTRGTPHTGGFRPRPPLAVSQWQRPSLEAFALGPHLEIGGMASLQTKRGCPLDCSYCTYPLLEGHSMRLREPSDVVNEIGGLLDRGVDYLFFVDNNFNIPGAHALAICRKMERTGTTIKWTAFLTPNGFDEELAGAMAAAGARSVEFGAEAAATETLAGLGKHHTADDILRCDTTCTAAGVTPAHYFIFGGPGETMDTLQQSLDLIDRLQGPVVCTLAVRIYPNTGLQARAISEGQITADDPLLDPVFYISPHIDLDAVLERLTAKAAEQRNFLVLGSEVGIDKDIITRLRKKGRRGPLWEYLRR